MTNEVDLTPVIYLQAALQYVKTRYSERTAKDRQLFERGDRKTVWRDGVNLGSCSLSNPTPVWRVEDPDAFLEWVEREYPNAVITKKVVVPRWQEEFLAGNPVDTATGEIPPGITQVVPTPAFTVTPSKETKASVKAWLSRELEGGTSGNTDGGGDV